MALSTLDWTVMFFLILGVGLSIWYFGVAYNYRNTLSKFSNSRGANVSGVGKTANLSCDSGKVICVYRATQICTDPGNPKYGFINQNFENPTTDPISNGLDGGGKYGEYSTKTTTNLTKDMSEKCNGKSECAYVHEKNVLGVCQGTSQLIATYTCIPPGVACQSAY